MKKILSIIGLLVLIPTLAWAAFDTIPIYNTTANPGSFLGSYFTASSATTTVKMGKIQFDGYNVAGVRVCAEVSAANLFIIIAGACTP